MDDDDCPVHIREHDVVWVPRLLRGQSVPTPVSVTSGQSLMSTFAVVPEVKLIDEDLHTGNAVRGRAFVQPCKQGLVEPLVIALGRRFAGFSGDHHDPHRRQVGHQLGGPASSGTVERGPVVRQEFLWDHVGGDCFGYHCQRPGGGFCGVDVGCQGQAGVVVDELEDHAAVPVGQRAFGAVNLPEAVRGGIGESLVP